VFLETLVEGSPMPGSSFSWLLFSLVCYTRVCDKQQRDAIFLQSTPLLLHITGQCRLRSFRKITLLDSVKCGGILEYTALINFISIFEALERLREIVYSNRQNIYQTSLCHIIVFYYNTLSNMILCLYICICLCLDMH
jgi:hypothetical protein